MHMLTSLPANHAKELPVDVACSLRVTVALCILRADARNKVGAPAGGLRTTLPVHLSLDAVVANK